MQPLSQGLVIAERYRLERKLGAGGMGSVWLASDLSLDSTCAIKLVDPDKVGNEEVRVRFQREARAAAQIRSANVVDVFDHGLWRGVPFIVMEYLQGEDLGARLDRQGRLDLAQTYDIVAQVARALVRAHAMGIVHRDLKPENIFLVPGDDHEVAKVLDFGIAKLDQYSLRDKTTKTGSFMGTPYYMSPEQARGKNIDWRSDLWALGVIVVQCLTEKFWERAINRDRELRFQSAKELADALAQTAMLERREIPTLPPRASLPSLIDSDQASAPATTHNVGRNPFDAAGQSS
ncbi:MAG: protein kinase, partial [Polyangiaceae bacterium]|nr:protein kinase [Polyangiaceae bacterium]